MLNQPNIETPSRVLTHAARKNKFISGSETEKNQHLTCLIELKCYIQSRDFLLLMSSQNVFLQMGFICTLKIQISRLPSDLACIHSSRPFFLVSSLWSFFRRKISIIVGYDLIDFPLFLPPSVFFKNLQLPPFPLPPPVPYSPVLPPACPTPKTKMTSRVQLRLVLQSLCDHVQPND